MPWASVPHEIDEVPAIGFEGVLRLEHIAHPGHQCVRGTVPIGRRGPGVSEEGLDLGGNRFLSLQELTLFRGGADWAGGWGPVRAIFLRATGQNPKVWEELHYFQGLPAER